MKLLKLLERLDYTCLQGDMDKEITGIYNDSRKVTEGALFLCIRGAVSDGHAYAAQVAEKGASVIVVQDSVEVPESVTVIQVEDSRYAMALIAAAWYDYPAEKLRVIGITGTKGKTTTTYMIRSILEAAGHKVGLIGTIEAIIGDKVIPACNTTPESMTIQEYFAEMVQIGCDSVVMEVSSQGLMLHRTAGILFEIGIFTNLEPDHIGPAEHSSFEEYLECKSRLFRQCKLGIMNADDKHLEEILKGHTCQVETYGFAENADFRATDTKLVSAPGYLGIDYYVSGKRNFQVEIDIPGKFSVYNSLAAIAVCDHFGVTDENIVSALRLAKVKGRIEMIKVSDEFTLMIDYAHNAMALKSIIRRDWCAYLDVVETVPNPDVLKWVKCLENWQILQLSHRITQDSKNRRQFWQILNQLFPKQKENTSRSQIGKRPLPMRFITDSRGMLSYWQEKVMKIIRKFAA